MPRVICDLPNASDLINGVKFDLTEDGFRISEEVTDEVAALFASIPGYAIYGEQPKKDEQPAVTEPVEDQPTETTEKKPAKGKTRGSKGKDEPAPAPAPAEGEADGKGEGEGEVEGSEPANTEVAGTTETDEEVF